MKKRIGIVTCHTPQNYGAMLQAYGLQQYLLEQGCFPEIINYAPDIYFEELSLLYIGDQRIRNNIFLRISYIVAKLYSRLIRRKNFKRFKHRFLNITRHRYKSYDELVNNCPVYDQYIAGSDQIWNTRGLRGWNPTFYLGFVKDTRKRHAYAASMSLDLPISEDVKSKVFPMIEAMNNVSLREEEITQTIQPFLRKQVTTVVDPVYLIGADKWRELSSHAKSETTKYILIYPMGDVHHVVDTALRLSQVKNLPIYSISASKRKIKGVDKQFDCSVEKFVKLFDEAEYVITNSFHGTSFSIILNKQFWSCEVEHNNHRITNLLNRLELGNRYISKQCTMDDTNDFIDFSSINVVLDNMINDSKLFLSKIINDESNSIR